ncbi:armadillo-type protein, partial [Haematococcus lacustris]
MTRKGPIASKEPQTVNKNKRRASTEKAESLGAAGRGNKRQRSLSPAQPSRARTKPPSLSQPPATTDADAPASAPVAASVAASAPEEQARPAPPQPVDHRSFHLTEMSLRSTGRDEEEQDDAGPGSASMALQGLLRKLGAGFDDILGGMGGGSRFRAILANLRQVDDESSQLGALTELCEVISISSEDALASFPIESAVPLLVQCLNAEHNPDMMLLAARALTFMADVIPQSCAPIVRHGAVSSFCQRLLTIEYIDLAEQSLQALEKLSHEHSPALLQQGGLLAVLSYLDFFPTSVQRMAVATASTMCRNLSPSSLSMVQEAVPLLINLLQNTDPKVVNSACSSLSHIASALGSQPGLLTLLSSSGLIPQALQLIALSESGTVT